MELWAPTYYKNFKCLAGACPHTCCAGWEIDVDAETSKRYRAMGGYLADSLSEDGASFVLSADERCPHLGENGLCRIISQYGEELLCDVCREHPRFYTFAPDRAEVGVGMSCYAAASLILSSEYEVKPVGQRGGESFEGLDTVALREHIYSTLRDRATPYEKRVKRICEELGVDVTALDGEFYTDVFASLEYLSPENAEKFAAFDPHAEAPKGFDDVCERFLAYFIFRHCTEAADAEDYRARLAFCLLCERLFRSLLSRYSDSDPLLLACAVSEELEYSTLNTETVTDALYGRLL